MRKESNLQKNLEIQSIHTFLKTCSLSKKKLLYKTSRLEQSLLGLLPHQFNIRSGILSSPFFCFLMGLAMLVLTPGL